MIKILEYKQFYCIYHSEYQANNKYNGERKSKEENFKIQY